MADRTAGDPAITLIEADTPVLVALARELFREYAESIGVDLEYQGFSAELAGLPRPYVPPGGTLLIARAKNAAAGCVALRRIDARAAEMKRLYVRKPWRGSGLGRRLVEGAIEAARRVGYEELRLDTLPAMAAAQALYTRLGFVEIPPYGESHLPGTRFYALRLAP